MEVGERVTLLPFYAKGRIESVYHDGSGRAVYSVKMDDPNFNESGYMLARYEEFDEARQRSIELGLPERRF